MDGLNQPTRRRIWKIPIMCQEEVKRLRLFLREDIRMWIRCRRQERSRENGAAINLLLRTMTLNISKKRKEGLNC